jgi:CMP-N-acetylneuraminic acid synthetase
MLEIAAGAGAEVCLRDPFYATDTVPMSDVYAEMARQLECDEILLTHVTNPLAGPDVYHSCMNAYRERGALHDSLTTVSAVKEFLYRDGKPLNYDPACKPRSQDLPDIVKLNHVVSILPRDMMISKKDAMGFSPVFRELGAMESLDIDTELDFEIAEFLYSKNLRDSLP